MAQAHRIEAPGTQQMARDSLDQLESHNVLALYQDLLGGWRICCAVQNRYKLASVPKEKERAVLRDPDMRLLPTLYEIREDPSVCFRCWCSIWRKFRLGVFPPDTPERPSWPRTEPLIVLERPSKCSWWWKGLHNPQQILVTVNGQRVGHAEQDIRCPSCLCSCTVWTKVFDADRNQIYTVRAPGCGEGCGKNCCAPSWWQIVYEMDVFNAGNEFQRVGILKNIWRNDCSEDCNASAPTSSNFVLVFPEDATLQQKGLLLGALFLQDFSGEREC